MTEKVVTLAHDTKTDGASQVVAFLREQADLIEAGNYVADAAVIVFLERRGALFKTGTRRCNIDLLQQLGLLQCALSDVVKTDY